MWPDIHFNVTNLGSALNVLAAMITPALLLSACGTFILSTSNRLARIVDRMRSLSHQLDEMSQAMSDVALKDERIAHHRGEIKLQGRRLNLIQRALTLLYLAAVSYVLTSVAIGLASTFTLVWVYWVPVFFGIGGACCMLAASVMLALEARLAVKDLYDETEFHRRLARYYSDQEQQRLPEA